MLKTKTSGETTRLKKIAPQQWRSRVAALPLKIRTEVAHVIWWDWFGGRNVTERWTHLDTFIKRPKWHQPTDAQIIEGLMLCGYSQAYASKRIRENSNKSKSKK
jgi:hypothetical protein